MNTYYTTDEKYLKAVEKYYYGKTPKSLQLLNDIIAADPQYARAYFQLGKIYFYELKDYQQAGYCFKTCNELDAAFPDVYYHYMRLLSFLNMTKTMNSVKEKALQTPGVEHAGIWEILALNAEKNNDLALARSCYEKAFEIVTSSKRMENIQDGLNRIEEKQQRKKAYLYSLS